MPIDALPSPAAPNDDVATFNTKMFAWVAALQTWTTQANAVEAAVDADAAAAAVAKAAAELAEAAAELAAAAAQSNAQAAAASAGASIWVSGTTYAIGDVRWSPVSRLSYRRITAGAGTTDPSLDTTNWAALSARPALTRIALIAQGVI